MNSYKIGYEKLNEHQRKVLNECYLKKNGGLSLPMGYGKTIIGTLLGLYLGNTKKTLIVVSKSLIGGFITEFKKFFDDTLSYQVLHQEYISGKKLENFNLEETTQIVLTTSEVISKIYKKNQIEEKFIRVEVERHHGYLQHETVIYDNPRKPLMDGGDSKGANILFSREWGCLIIDEIQKFTNITVDKARGLASIYSKHRWGMSGTIFDEPKLEKLLGYYTILNIPDTPRDLQKFKSFVTYGKFKGTKETTVHRDSVEFIKLPKVNQQIIKHELCYEEIQIYINMKGMIDYVSNKIRGSTGTTKRRFSAFLLALIVYLRQSIISPLIPIANLVLDLYSFDNKSDLSKELFKRLLTLDVKDYLKNPNNIISSRIKKVLEVAENHKDEKLVIFTGFRTSLDLIKNLLIERNRPVITISGSHSSEKRRTIVDDFNKRTDNTIFLLTYDIGCEGLNLQSSKNVLLVDLSWNSCKSSQAVARVLRQGQSSDTVNVYYFTSNLQIEQSMFLKHVDKTRVINELADGNSKMQIDSIKVKDIINLLNTEDNLELLKRII